MANPVLIVLGSIVGCGLLAAFGMWLTGRGDKKSDLLNLLHKKSQEEGVKKLEEIEEKQKIVAVNIKEKEELSKEAREKIKKIQIKAAEEITITLQEDSLKKIQDEIDEDWGDL
jgi:uncharacterized protein YfkK (UPF0435 family)